MAVFTELTELEIVSVVNQYDCGDLISFTGVTEGSENTTYLCHTTKGNYILTIFEARSNIEDVKHQVSFLRNLHEAKIKVPKILNKKNGGFLCDIAGKFALIQTFIFGDVVMEPSIEQCYAAGESLAKIHNIGSANKTGISNSCGVTELKIIANKINVEHGNDELSQALDFLNNYKTPKNIPVGGIHGDYFNDNIFFKGNKVSGIFDFWFSCDDLLIYDLAASLNVWGFINDELNQEFYDAFLNGYESERKLTTAEEQALPQELIRSSARFYLTRLFDKLMTNKNLKNKPPAPWLSRFEQWNDKSE